MIVFLTFLRLKEVRTTDHTNLLPMKLEGRTAMEEKNESRINIEDLPQAEQELTDEETQEVNGGAGTMVKSAGALQNSAGTNTW